MDLPGIELGPLTITFYALILLAGIVAAGGFTAWQARRMGLPAGLGYELASWGLIGGLAGARLAFVLLPPPSVAGVLTLDWVLRHPFDLQLGPLALWSGGLDSGGAAIAAGLVISLLLWRARLPLHQWPALMLPGLIALLLIAPYGNLVNRHLLGPALNWPGALADSMGVLRLPTPLLFSTWAGLAPLMRLGAQKVLPGRDPEALTLAWIGLGWLWLGAYQMDVARALIGLSLLQGAGLLLCLIALILALRSLATSANT